MRDRRLRPPSVRSQDLEGLRGETEAELSVQERRLLFLREAEVERAQLEQPALGAELGDRDRRSARLAITSWTLAGFASMKYASDACRRAVDGLVVVEDENQFAVERLELPDDDRDERIVDIDVAAAQPRPRLRNRAGRAGSPPRSRSTARPGRCRRSGREPGERSLVELTPLREERRLPESRRRGERGTRPSRRVAPQPRLQDHLRRGREAQLAPRGTPTPPPPRSSSPRGQGHTSARPLRLRAAPPGPRGRPGPPPASASSRQSCAGRSRRGFARCAR